MRAEAERNGDHSLSSTREAYLYRARQKLLDVDVVEVDGCWHGGAHMPLFIPIAHAIRAFARQETGEK